MNIDKLDEFTRSYIECALWCGMDDDYDRQPEELAEETMQKIVADCKAFQESNADLLSQAGSDSENGHDFWLTRNHHGAGFWDRGYSDGIGDKLTEASHACGECDLYIGDDGKIYT